ncbi:helix-turn-helix domain-containing protein [Phocaeicola vulgatus]|jgi:excisionase family DNA binding protein|uniref:DNA-binding protein n=1 Tax=Phocaeicola vulgatus TaxID=821 RepID=A0A415DEV0_PHOVU|nr:helix-turn-helix domain-containing protein [Phocaeicola vulgatus]RHJ74612.1 DNA-binding protein [Phocaeicola vulgatus]
MRNLIRIQKKCEWCGKEFTAYKCSTRFCCKQCNDHAYKAKKRELKVQSVNENLASKNEPEIIRIQEKEFLSPTETAQLLGMSRATLYRYLLNGLIPAVQFKGKTKIRRSSLEKIFDTPKQYQKHTKSPRSPITDFYTTAEVASKYGVNESWIFKVGKEQNIPKVFKRGKTYWSAKHFDKYFASKAPDSNITEWYSVEDLTEKFGMTTSAIYSFVSRFAIPKKKIKRQVFYSKKHVDIAKGLAKAEPEYYTTAEAMEKYNLTRDQLYHYVKWHHISKVQEGKYIKISRKELDDLLAPPSI